MGFVVSMVSWFHGFRGVKSFIVSWVSFHGLSMVSWFHRFPGVNGFMGFVVSMVSWFHRFRGVNGFMVL